MPRTTSAQKIATLEQKNLELITQVQAAQAEVETLKTTHETKITEKDAKIQELEGRIEEKQDQLNDHELKTFAQAFAKQETRFQESAETWFKYVAGAFVVTLIGSYILITQAHQSPVWYEKISYYLVDIILLTSLVFSLKQYTYYIKLSTDYGNRKTLAQSYHNIITSVDDAPIKEKFLNEAIAILASRAEVKDEPNTIPEKLAESMGEALKTLANKV